MKKAIFVTLLLIVSVKVYYFFSAEKRIGPEVKAIELAAFDIPQIDDVRLMEVRKKSIAALEGVTACTINHESKIAAITFDPQLINVNMLSAFLTAEFQEEIGLHHYPASDKVCPVHEPGKWFSQLFK